MKNSSLITALLLDIGAVLLTDGWSHGEQVNWRNSDHATKYISRLCPFSTRGVPPQRSCLRRRNMNVGTRAGRVEIDFSNTLSTGRQR
jgi:hypothetical protein